MERMKFFIIFLALALFANPSFAARQVLNENASPSAKGGLNSNFSKANANFVETYAALDLKETKAVVQASAPADTTVDWYDTDQESGVLILKRHNGTTWLRASSHGVQYLSSCASIAAGFCVDTDDGKLYYHNNTSVVEVGTGSGSYTLPTASEDTLGGVKVGSRLTITDGVLSADVQSGTGAVDSVNGATGTVVLDADDISDTSTTKKFTTAAEKVTWDAKQDAVETSPLTASMITGLFTGTEDCLGANGETVACGGNGGGTWGSITGTLSDQTDLQAALEAISAGGIPHVSSGYPSTSGAWNYNTTDNRLYTRKSNGDVYYTSALTLAAAADVTPAAFTFADVTDAELSTEYTRCVQITDIDWPANVTASSPAAAVCTGDNTGCGTFGTSPGTVANNGWVCARHTSSASNSTATNTPVTVGTESDTFTSTTAAASGLTPTFYFNANSATSGQSPTIGTGTITIGAGTAAVTGVVGNALEIDSTWGGSLNFPGSGNISATTGTLGFYIYSANYVQNGSYVSRASMSSPYFLLEAGTTTQWRYMSGGSQALELTNSTWSFVELSWDYANGRKAYRINGGTWQEVTGLTGSAPTINDVVFGSVDGNVTSFRIDQIIITSGYQDDVYSVRDNTSF